MYIKTIILFTEQCSSYPNVSIEDVLPFSIHLYWHDVNTMVNIRNIFTKFIFGADCSFIIITKENTCVAYRKGS